MDDLPSFSLLPFYNVILVNECCYFIAKFFFSLIAQDVGKYCLKCILYDVRKPIGDLYIILVLRGGIAFDCSSSCSLFFYYFYSNNYLLKFYFNMTVFYSSIKCYFNKFVTAGNHTCIKMASNGSEGHVRVSLRKHAYAIYSDFSRLLR